MHIMCTLLALFRVMYDYGAGWRQWQRRPTVLSFESRRHSGIRAPGVAVRRLTMAAHQPQKSSSLLILDSRLSPCFL